MKKILFLFILLFIVGCGEDKNEIYNLNKIDVKIENKIKNNDFINVENNQKYKKEETKINYLKSENDYKESINEIVDNVEVINVSEVMKNENKIKKKIVIDAGHQRVGNNEKEPIGPGSEELKAKVASGTKGVVTNIPEYELTLEISLKLREKLINEGYEVVMIRDNHDVNISNAERAIIANNTNGDLFLRIHANGSEDSSVTGILTLCPTKDNIYCAEIHEKSYNASKTIVDEMCLYTNDKNLGVMQTDTMSGINWCEIPVSIIEVGFMSNQETDLLLQTDDYQNKIVDGIVSGINKYFKNIS